MICRIVFCILSASLLWGCTHLKKDPYQDDVRYFFDKIREIHPDPYAHIDVDSFNRLEQTLIKDCKTMTDLRELNVRLLECNQYLDDHTYVGIHPDFYHIMRLFDFPLEIKNDSLFWLPTGEQIVSIDTFKTEVYLHAVRKFIPANLFQKMKDRYCSSFANFLILNQFRAPRYLEVYDNQNKQIVKREFEKRVPISGKKHSEYSFYCFPEDSIAIIEYNTSFISNYEQWEKDIHCFFDTIKQTGVKHLFIDVRNNGGGSDLNHTPIYNILKSNGRCFNVEYITTKKGRIALLKSALKNADHLHITYQKSDIYKALIKEYLSHQTTIESICQSDCYDGYDKNIYILQSNNTFSAAASFCYHVRFTTDCVLVGESIGQPMPSYGNRLEFRLPNTKIPFYIATNKTFYKTELPHDHGFLLPDISFVFRQPDTLFMDELINIIKIKKTNYVKTK